MLVTDQPASYVPNDGLGTPRMRKECERRREAAEGAPLDWPLLPPKLRDFLRGLH